MPRTRRVLTPTLPFLAAALLAVPAALATEADPFSHPADPLPDPQPAPSSAAPRDGWTAVEHELASAATGPVHPLLGTPDYGDAEARFGAARTGHVHAGQDIFAPAGTPEVAVSDGVVVDSGTDSAQGNHLAIYDPRRDRTYVYMHMLHPAEVDPGERVEAGQRVGQVGCTGSCWGNHLHFEIRDGRGTSGEAHDPLPQLRGWSQAPQPAR